MKVRKRKNRRKIVYAYSKPAPLVGFVIVIVVTALVYSYLVYSCQILGDEIKRMERQQVELKNRYINEECRWMEEKEYESVEQLKGSMSRQNCPDPSAYARGNYMKALATHVGPAI